MATESEPEYPLTRDYLDIARLNLQHYLITEMFGYLVHPAIDITSNKNLKVADVGCGTAIWSISLASKLPPTAEIIALDITLDQAPPEEYLPPSVSLRVWNVFEAVPEELVGYFDVVHIRMFLLVTNDPVKLLRNLLRLLKPGGWVQWGELDAASIQIEKPTGETTDTVLGELQVKMGEVARGIVPIWPGDMNSVFEAAGCHEISVQTIRPRRDLDFMMHGANLVLYDMLAQTSKYGTNEQRSEISQLVSQAANEAKKGTIYTHKRCTAVGRKPFAPRKEKA